MTPTRPALTSAQVLAWISVLLAFGITQGVIYLKSFWGRFGLDPFQFSNASDLAIVGLTGIGVTLAFMAGAALLGGYLGDVLVHRVPKNKVALGLIACVLIVGLLLLVKFVDFGIYLLLGMLLTWALIWLVHNSPDIPDRFKHIKVLGYIALAVAYIPMASHYLGQWKAKAVQTSDSVLVLGGGLEHLDTDRELRLVGRLGGEYIFFSPVTRSITIVQASSVESMTLKVVGKPAVAESDGAP